MASDDADPGNAADPDTTTGASDVGGDVVKESTVLVERMQSHAQAHRGRLARRIVVTMLVLFVGAGAFGVFGYRSSTTQAHAEFDGSHFDVTLTYPERSRGGLPAHWFLIVERADGAPLPRLEVRTTASYLDLFDFNSLTPEPDAMSQSDVVSWTYEPTGNASIRIVLDVRVQPDRRFGHDATTTVLADGSVIAQLDYRTWVSP